MPAITLVKNTKERDDKYPKFDVLLFGHRVGQLYYNTRGYQADYGLPTPEGRHLNTGEVSITKFRAEVVNLNRDYALLAFKLESTKLLERRRIIIERLESVCDYNGFQVKGDDGWSHAFLSDEFEKVVYVDNEDDKGGPSLKKTVTLKFHKGTAIVSEATIGGEDIDGGSFVLYPFKKHTDGQPAAK